MYIDPGYGVLILQGAFAAVLGAFFFARQKIVHFVRKLTGRTPASRSDAAREQKSPPTS